MFDLIKVPWPTVRLAGLMKHGKKSASSGREELNPLLITSIIINIAHCVALRPDGGVAGHPLKNSIITKQLTQ